MSLKWLRLRGCSYSGKERGRLSSQGTLDYSGFVSQTLLITVYNQVL